MFPNMIDETPYDLRWQMFGIPVRVHPLFWLISILFSWSLIERGLQYVALGVLCVFVSILLHELGHVVVGRWFGSRGHIVLWAFGGLAIGSNQLDRRGQRIAVLIAGPLVQLILFGLIILALILLPHSGEFELTEWYIPPQAASPYPLPLAIFLSIVLQINFYWALLNLLPIWPLDGGQISRELFTWGSPRNGIRLALQLSIGVAGLLALHAIMAHTSGRGIPGLPSGVQSAIFFAVFVFMGVQALQVESQRDHWSDDHRWY